MTPATAFRRDACHAIAMYEAFTAIVERTLDEAPGLPLELADKVELDRWTTALTTVLMNLGALNTLWRDGRRSYIAALMSEDER